MTAGSSRVGAVPPNPGAAFEAVPLPSASSVLASCCGAALERKSRCRCSGCRHWLRSKQKGELVKPHVPPLHPLATAAAAVAGVGGAGRCSDNSPRAHSQRARTTRSEQRMISVWWIQPIAMHRVRTSRTLSVNERASHTLFTFPFWLIGAFSTLKQHHTPRTHTRTRWRLCC